MLEGGNKQLGDFFERHMLKVSNGDTYRTNAAKFYKQNLFAHVLTVGKSGEYLGRRSYRTSQSSSSTSSHCQTHVHKKRARLNIH